MARCPGVYFDHFNSVISSNNEFTACEINKLCDDIQRGVGVFGPSGGSIRIVSTGTSAGDPHPSNRRKRVSKDITDRPAKSNRSSGQVSNVIVTTASSWMKSVLNFMIVRVKKTMFRL